MRPSRGDASLTRGRAMASVPAPVPGLKQRLASRWPIGELTGWAGASGFGSRSTATEVLADEDLRGRVYIVTGGAAGLGRATAAALSAAGAHVVLAVRNASRGDIAAAELGVEALRAGRGGSVSAMYCDLASFASVRAFACSFVASGKALNALICNAGLLPQPFALTEDGHEQIWQVNYLSHALLVELLLPVLERSGGRVVLVSSLVHHLGYRGGIRWEAVDSPVGFVPWKAYSQSKLALLLHARALDVTLASRGSHVVVHAVHPGAVPTRGAAAAEAHTGAAGSCLSTLGGRFHRTVAQGAASIVYAAASRQLDAGRGAFVCNANRADGHASAAARDQLLAFRLYDFGREAAGCGGPPAAAASTSDALPVSVDAGQQAPPPPGPPAES